MGVWVAQSCLTLCNHVNCGLPVSSVHGILQARILEWVAISFSSGSSRPRGWTQVSHIAGRFFTIWATRGALWQVIVLPWASVFSLFQGLIEIIIPIPWHSAQHIIIVVFIKKKKKKIAKSYSHLKFSGRSSSCSPNYKDLFVSKGQFVNWQREK